MWRLVGMLGLDLGEIYLGLGKRVREKAATEEREETRII